MADILLTADYSQVTQADKAVDSLGNTLGKVASKGSTNYAKTTEKATKATTKFDGAVVGNTKKMSSMGVVTQQAGYQVGDFLVQIQSGANPMMAFGQQATQLVGVLPLMSDMLNMSVSSLIGLSAGLGIGIPLVTAIAGAMLAGRKSVASFKDQMEELSDAVMEYTKLSDLGSDSTQASLEHFGSASSALKLIIKDLQDISKIKAFEELNSTLESLVNDNFNGFESQLENVKDMLGGGLSEANEFLKVVQGMANELRPLEQRLEKGLELRAYMLDLSGGFESMTELQRVFYQGLVESIEKMQLMSDAAKDLDSSSIGDKFKSTMGEIRAEATIVSQEAANMLEHLGLGWKEASKLQEEMEDVKDYALGVTEADMEAGIRAAAAAAAVLAEKMGISLGLALELVALAGKSKAENAFDASVSTGRFPPGAKGDFNVEGGDTPVALQSYLDRVDARVKARAAAARKSRGGGGSAKAKGEKDPLGDLLKRIELDTKLLGVSEERAEVMRKLGDDASKYNQDEVDAVVNRLGLYNQEKEALELVQNTQQSIADTLKSSMSEAFMSMVDGTKSFKDAMKDMAKSVIKQLFDILVVQRLVGSFDSKSGKGTGLVGAIMGALPFANGGAFSSGSQIQAYADGGVVGGPTMFPMSGGKTGLMGEAGPEAIMPLKRGKNGKLGVETSGSGSVVVNNNFNIAANGDESVKRIIQGEMPKISEATKRAVVDSKRRGGSYGRSF